MHAIYLSISGDSGINHSYDWSLNPSRGTKLSTGQSKNYNMKVFYSIINNAMQYILSLPKSLMMGLIKSGSKMQSNGKYTSPRHVESSKLQIVSFKGFD